MSGERHLPSLLFANDRGEIQEYDGLKMAGMAGGNFFRPSSEDIIPLPEGSELFSLSGRLPVGLEPGTNTPALLDVDPYDGQTPIQAVAAFLPPAHTATYWAAFERQPGCPVLPLFAYFAVGWKDNRFWAAAFRCDADSRQDPIHFHQPTIEKKTAQRLAATTHNRLIQHLGTCCLTYGCPAARNYFLDRWEAPLPSSPVCNADCIGCISLQTSGCCPSTQQRIGFAPTPEELAEVAVSHLRHAARPIVSFGQGCEGEPLLQAKTIAAAIRLIRQRTDRGTINCNTNASLPEAVAMLAETGLDSMRVSLNSAQPHYHQRYYRPKGFSFTDVCASIRAMKKQRRFVSLNYFILPGFTDDPAEFAALCELVKASGPDLIQLRNLNMDPDLYCTSINFSPSGTPMGIRNWQQRLARRFPRLRFGYFNPCLR
ncbi:MAG: radical SAM protein [Desulfobulbus propionicus]|nr:MAG: radical SAM protein [Desulfobulbus propionicus]